MSAKLLNLLALSSLAILAGSFGPQPVTALSIVPNHEVFPRAHHATLAKKKRATGAKRCKPRSPPAAGGTTASPKPSSAAASSAKPSSQASHPPTTTPSSTPKPPPSNAGGNKKFGLAWAQNDNTALSHFAGAGPVMTWSPWIPDNAKSLGLIPCPMLWGPKQITQFNQLVKPGYANCILGFNEPNQQGQSDLDPGYAAQLWQQHIQPKKNDGYALITPACTNAPSGKTWMKSFMAACSGCTFDGLAVHVYTTDPQAMIDYITDMHNTFGLPIWVTEYACQNFSGGAQCSVDQVWSFSQKVKSFMDSQSWVSHYFPFGALYNMGNVNPANQLLASNGYPTDLGRFYLGQ